MFRASYSARSFPWASVLEKRCLYAVALVVLLGVQFGRLFLLSCINYFILHLPILSTRAVPCYRSVTFQALLGKAEGGDVSALEAPCESP